MSMGRVRGERDTVFRRMDFIEGPRPFQKVKIQYLRAARAASLRTVPRYIINRLKMLGERKPCRLQFREVLAGMIG